MTCGVYRIIHIESGKSYLGSSVDIENRWNKHRAELEAGKHYNHYLQRAYIKYGRDAFSFDVVEECSEVIRLELEQTYLDREMPVGMLYNISPIARRPPGGKPGMGVGRKMATKSIAQSVATRRANGGYEVPPETRAKLRAYWTDERKAAFAERMKRAPSEETRQKMSAAKLGKSRPAGSVDKYKATMTAKGPEAEAERVAKIVATSALKLAAKSPEELAEAEARRQAKKQATLAARSPEKTAEIYARTVATRQAKKTTISQKIRNAWARKSPEEMAEIRAKMWATRRAKKLAEKE